MIKGNLISIMNNSKWNNVYLNFQDIKLPFLYRSKTLDGNYFPESDNELRFDCREVFPEKYKDIEWLEIHSKEKINLGKLVEPKIKDYTKVAKEIAINSKARFIETEYGIKIVGYVNNSEINKVKK